MSKKVARQRKNRAKKASRKGIRRPTIVICALLLLIFVFGVTAQWKILPGSSKPMAIAPAPQTGSFNAQSPSKEYIYAGGRLIATEEPGGGGGGTPPSHTPYYGQPINVPAELVQAEDFDNGPADVAYHDSDELNQSGQYRNTQVDIEACGDTNGGHNLSWVVADEWLKYTINVTTAGTYTIQTRVASPVTGGTFHIKFDGVDETGPMTIPNTGGWQTYTNVPSPGVYLTAGQHVMQVYMLSNGAQLPGGAAFVGNINYFSFTTNTSSGQTPYEGTPLSLPGRVEAEKFDNGGEDVAYHDTSQGNTGTQFRDTDVDIEACGDTGGGYNVGWAVPGEWLEYTVNVTTTGTYTIGVRVASGGPGGSFRVKFDGVDKTGPMVVQNTGGWQSYVQVSVSNVQLTAGQHVMRIEMDPGSYDVGNINYIDVLSESSSNQTPYGGQARPIPGKIEAEDYDNGGPDIAYLDTTPAVNEGGAYRTNEGVDLETCSDGANCHTLSWTKAGEWTEYTINVSSTGTYMVEARVTSAVQGGTFRIEFDGVNKTGSIAIPNTGGWQSWQTVVRSGVNLTAGPHVMKLVMETDGAPLGNGAQFVGNINNVTFSLQSPYSGQPIDVPTMTVQAEDFDNGADGVAYHDIDVENRPNQYRNTGVDIEACGDTNGGHNLSWAVQDEWLEYTINVTTSGTYVIYARAASAVQGGTFHIEIDGVDKTGPITVPNTGGWQTYTNVPSQGVYLTAGQHVMRVHIESNGAALPDGAAFLGNINYFTFAGPQSASLTDQLKTWFYYYQIPSLVRSLV